MFQETVRDHNANTKGPIFLTQQLTTSSYSQRLSSGQMAKAILVKGPHLIFTQEAMKDEFKSERQLA